ncbi:hypothetical protein H5410_002777, partial [Solanum commersonii]
WLRNKAPNEVVDLPKNVVLGDAKKSNVGIVPPTMLLEMSGNAMCMKQLFTKKRNNVVFKKDDPGAFTIPCTI